MILFYVMNALE